MIGLTALFEAGIVVQSVVSRTPDVDPGVGLGGSAVSAFLSTLLVGGILIALTPAYTERLVDRIADDAIGSFIYGLLVLVSLILVVVVLALTIVGVVVAVPLAIVVGLMWAAGAAIAFVAIGERLAVRPRVGTTRPEKTEKGSVRLASLESR
ncbi:hypothetical protein [Salinibaculum rarum]|uniref:hypothetical protein n=1 Tax=Salinibaculum rarum TaxID=3058903 RepID=UPI00265D68BE|nr:hypothetical protein [Salinibaculum sp. KK48]